MIKETVSGIYKITNLINGKVYIGQSKNIYNRWERHKSNLKNNKHQNKHLQRAWNKYGEQNFKFEIIEYTENKKDKLNGREIYWIRQYNSFKNGYNSTEGGEGVTGVKLTREQILKTKKTKPIYQINIEDGSIIKEWYGAREASKILHIKQDCIWSCCWNDRKTYKGFIWIFKEFYDMNTFDLNYYINNQGQPIKIAQCDNNGNLIKVWNSAQEAQKYNIINKFDCSGIIKCCKHKQSSHKNFIWIYYNEFVNYGILKHIEYIENKKNEKENPVLQFDKKMHLIKKWNTPLQANKSLGISVNGIYSCCNKQLKTSGGYIWIYEKDYNSSNNIKYIQYRRDCKKVIQLNLYDEIIKIWDSAIDVEKNIKIKHQNIGAVCRGKQKTSGGFKWMYLEDYNKLNENIS